MNDDLGIRNFTLLEDALIRQQPVTSIGITRLAQLLRTTQEVVRNRATELGVSLVMSLAKAMRLSTRGRSAARMTDTSIRYWND